MSTIDKIIVPVSIVLKIKYHSTVPWFYSVGPVHFKLFFASTIDNIIPVSLALIKGSHSTLPRVLFFKGWFTIWITE